MTTGSNWLDPFAVPIEKDGVLLPQRHKLILRAGITATDNPTKDATELDSIAAGSIVALADHNAFRALPSAVDGQVFIFKSPPGTFVYNSGTGAGVADDDKSVLKLTAVGLGSNGRAYAAVLDGDVTGVERLNTVVRLTGAAGVVAATATVINADTTLELKANTGASRTLDLTVGGTTPVGLRFNADDIYFRTGALANKGRWNNAGLRVGDANAAVQKLEVAGNALVAGNVYITSTSGPSLEDVSNDLALKVNTSLASVKLYNQSTLYGFFNYNSGNPYFQSFNLPFALLAGSGDLSLNGVAVGAGINFQVESVTGLRFSKLNANVYQLVGATSKSFSLQVPSAGNYFQAVADTIYLDTDSLNLRTEAGTGLSTGIAHIVSGVVSSSAIVNADVASNAAIAVTKLEAGAAGKVIWNDGSTNQWATIYVVKTKSADESVTSSTTLQDDDHLSFSIGANETWVARWCIWSTFATGGNGAKVAVTGPSGVATLVIGFIASDVETFANIASSEGTAINLAGGADDVNGMIVVEATIVNGANAGTINLQWAQVVSSGTPTVFKAKSKLVAMRK